MSKNPKKAPSCPYCQREDCVWTLSPLAGPNGADVRTSCGEALSVDALLGKARWHLDAAQRTARSWEAIVRQDTAGDGKTPSP